MPVPANFLALVLLFGVGLVSSVVAQPWVPFTLWVGVNLVVFLVLAWIALLAHEAAHAVAGRLAGLSLRAVRVGVGPQLLHAKLGETELTLRAVPDGGEVAFTARSIDGLKRRLVIGHLAGPALHLAVLVALCLVVGGEGLDDAFAHPWQSENAALAMGFLINTAYLVNLVPFEVQRPGGGAATTDVLRAMRVAGMGRDELLRMVAIRRYDDCRALIAAERGDEAAAIAHELLEENRLPELVVAVKWMYGTALLSARRYAEARAVLVESLGPPRPAGNGTALALSNAAWAALMTNDAALLDEADALSREALTRDGTDASIAATRGAVLLRLGRTRDAAPLVTRAWREGGSRRARAYRSAAMAVVAAREHHAKDARERLDEARTAWPECDLLAWAEEELASPRA
jgi:hypothetical protein